MSVSGRGRIQNSEFRRGVRSCRMGRPSAGLGLVIHRLPSDEQCVRSQYLFATIGICLLPLASCLLPPDSCLLPPDFSETWSWRWLSGRLRKFNKIEAKGIGAFA